MNTAPGKVTGTVVLTITYGFVGYWGEGFVNSTANSTWQLDFRDQDITIVVRRLREKLISKLHEDLTLAERQKFGANAEMIFKFYNVISEAQMFIP